MACCKPATSRFFAIRCNKTGNVMINRRNILAGAAALAFTASAASAQDWKTKYPELTFAVVPAENASGVTERWTPFVAYLSKELGVKVTLRIANDYAAVIEGQRAGNIHIASYGSASFARARLTGVKTDAFANDINADGSTGYYSAFFVKANSPYKSIDQLKGKNLGLVDPNSTSLAFPMPTVISARSSSPAATRTPCWRCRRARSRSPPISGPMTTIPR